MLADRTYRCRKALSEIRKLTSSGERHVDLAIKIKAIDDPDEPVLKIGGKFDKVTRSFVDTDADRWVTWEVGKGQLPPIRVRGGRFVIVGAMGAGKTEVLAICILLLAILFGRNSAVGAVAPTQKRMKILWQKIIKRLPPEWISEIRISEGEIELINGCKIQFVAAKIYSKEIGSPIQGYSWVSAGVDEEQDVEEEAMADVMMRGRESPTGHYPVISTCTLKDSPVWRTRKHRYENDRNTTLYRMSARANPFVPKTYWDEIEKHLTPRQKRMRVDALDARPERATYPDFDRGDHLRVLPEMGARDITRKITGYPMIIGHDPGTIVDVSVLLRAFDIRGEASPVWFVVDELTTHQSTSEQHASDLLCLLQGRWRVQFPEADSPRVIIRADPYGDTETRPHQTVYKEFLRKGMKIVPAQYSKNGTGSGTIPKEARIGMVNTLLKNAAGDSRLYIALNDKGSPCAPRLVEALETSERDAAGKAEADKKGKYDVSHWCAALGYALWAYERARIGLTPIQIASQQHGT